MDKFQEECGVFGIYRHPDAAAHTALGLHALQHRGQEAAGIVSFDGRQFYSHRALGLVGDHFNSAEVIARLKGDASIGHNRYSTSGEPLIRNVQPLFAEFSFGGLSLAHNGNLTNAYTLRQELIKRGAIFQSTSDTEVIVHLLATSAGRNVTERLIDAMLQVQGAYSLVVLARDGMYGVRDPLGVRPLVLGQVGESYVLASETCALDIVGGEYVRDIEPGEMVHITDEGIESLHPFPNTQRRFCIFEYVYFSRPDSMVEGHNVYGVRKQIGMQLAREKPTQADVVVPVPDSGVPAALGFAEASGIPFDLGIIRNHYIGRTFIEPTDQVRHLGVKLKHNANTGMLKGKRVVLVDDSIVRGTTSKKIVNMVREAGASEVHMRIASPPTTGSCYYGVDTPEPEKLLAANNSVAQMAKLIEADSLEFVSMDGLYRALGEAKRNGDVPQYCDACFSGDYPIPLTDRITGLSPKQKDLFQGVSEV
ncbi:MAG: amidophosphoribosyltransferase [Rickettsiales bacterium]|nr:amidophosphoribosyltransferase [Rickettsiales bacterium]|tara:strand:- start:501 stop:1937 length:1437 start_codon:yes stop_codon:yes gene_type:complete